MASIGDDSSTKSARDYIATLALETYKTYGLPVPSADELGGIVQNVEARLGSSGFHKPENGTAPVLAELNQQVLRALAVHRRPVNLYSAEAAHASQKGDGEPTGRKRGFADALNLSPSSARYQEMVAAGRYSGLSVAASGGDTPLKTTAELDWNSPAGLATTRGYALANDMAWATKQPDLMRLGQPALQALHEAKLKGDGYEDLHGKAHLNFDNRTIVAGAGYMKCNHLDYDEGAKAGARVHDNKALSGDERADWRKALGGIYRSQNPGSDATAQEKLRESGWHIKQHHPEMTPDVDRALKANGASADARLVAEVKAGKADTSNNDDSAKMAELLKRRKAAQAVPQLSH